MAEQRPIPSLLPCEINFLKVYIAWGCRGNRTIFFLQPSPNHHLESDMDCPKKKFLGPKYGYKPMHVSDQNSYHTLT
jgi:hypothetical protein